MGAIVNLTICIFLLVYWISATTSFLLLILCAGVLLATSSEGRRSPKFALMELPFITLTVYTALAITVGTINGQTVDSVKIYMLPLLIFFVFSSFRVSSRKWLDVYIAVLLVNALLISTIMYFQSEPGKFDFSIQFFLNRPRYNGFYFIGDTQDMGPTVIAAFIATGFLCSFYFFLREGGILARGIMGLLTSYFFLLQALAGSRTGLLATAVSAVLMLMLARGRGIGKRSMISYGRKLLVFGALLVVAIVAVRLAVEYSPGAAYRFSTVFEGRADHSMMTRFLLWGRALDFVNKNPFGYGPSYFYEMTGFTTHNEFLGVMVASGVAGLGLILIYWILMIRTALMCRPADSAVSAFFLSFFVILMLISLTENYSRSSSLLFNPMVYSVMGVIAALARAARKASRAVKRSYVEHLAADTHGV